MCFDIEPNKDATPLRLFVVGGASAAACTFDICEICESKVQHFGRVRTERDL